MKGKENIVPWSVAILGELARISSLFSDLLVILKVFDQGDEATFRLRDRLILPRWILDLSKPFLEKNNSRLLFIWSTSRLPTTWLWGRRVTCNKLLRSCHCCYCLWGWTKKVLGFWSLKSFGNTEKVKTTTIKKVTVGSSDTLHPSLFYGQCCSKSWQ